MKLFVDDVRTPQNEDWELRRTITESVKLLYQGLVEELSLDYDICHETGGQPGVFCSCPESYGVLAYVVALMPKKLRPKKVWLHSANPGGRKNMFAILQASGIDVEERPIKNPMGEYIGPDVPLDGLKKG